MPRNVDEAWNNSSACKEQLDIFLDTLKSHESGVGMIQTLFAKNVKTAFQGNSFSDLYAYFREDGEETGTTIRKDEKKDIYAEAAQECWGRLLDPPKKVCRTLNDALQDMRANACTPGEALERICSAVVDHLRSRVKDYVRNDDYRGLRQCIARKKELFYTAKDERNYLYFSPEKAKKLLPPLDSEVMKAFSQQLDTPDRTIRKMDAAHSWNCSIAAAEAQKFWDAYVKTFHKERPAFAPVYDMYRWLCDYMDMRQPVKVVIAQDDTLGEIQFGSVSENRISGKLSEDDDGFGTVFENEIKNLARDFARLTGNDGAMAEVLVRKYAGEKHEEIAAGMGWKSVANVNRQFEKFRRCVEEFASQHEALMELDSKMTFCKFVIMEWKKMVPSSDNGE